MRLLGSHNLTEGVPTAKDRRCDILACQEVADNARPALRAAGLKVYRPRRDPKQLLAWNPDLLTVVDRGYRRFHGSGEHEGWSRIATPGRGLVFIKARDERDRKIAVGGAWLLNSWGKPNEAERRAIVENLELPVIVDWVNDMRRWGAETIYLMGDFNNVRWDGLGLGMEQVASANGGLDRIFVWPKDVPARQVPNGPITGVGPDHKHESVHARVA
jgi:hypothetical protein